jgi:hypothetical protein
MVDSVWLGDGHFHQLGHCKGLREVEHLMRQAYVDGGLYGGGMKEWKERNECVG